MAFINECHCRFICLIGFEAFDTVVAGDEVTRPKPFPDPYLQAAEALGVDIRDTVSIEDSPTGVRSAVAAGGAVLAVPHMVSLVGLGAHHILDSLEQATPGSLAELVSAHRGASSEVAPDAEPRA